MITILSDSGRVLKVMPWEDGKRIGYHPLFGFVSESSFRERAQNRMRHGFAVRSIEFKFAFEMSGAQIANGANCSLEIADSGWIVKAGPQSFNVVRREADARALGLTSKEEKRDFVWLWCTLAAALIPLVIFLLPRTEAPPAPVVIDQTTVQLKQESKPPVQLKNALDKMPEVAKQAPETKRAIQQNLGFLGLLGRKDLSKAVGGAPTQLKDASAGAGAGTQGSGGELLVGLGAGLKRTTVGNTGVQGLGGVGTKGAGGGLGGYGNSAIGSGEGSRLAANSLAREAAIEGGLDRAVIEATIAKYLSQVRACYEEGLRREPSLTGQVTMSFEIGGKGNMNFANVKATTLNDSRVESCIATRMLSWIFPEPRGHVNVRATHPFMLRPTQL